MLEKTDFTDKRVAVACVDEYDPLKIYEIIKEHFRILEITTEMFEGKLVVIKPNLVSKKGPSGATTTHPEVVRAVVRYLKEAGANALIAESSSGVYTKERLKDIYESSQFFDIAREEGAEFNFDLSEVPLSAPDGVASKNFNIIKPLMDADIIVNLCKLKTHGLTKMTAAVKNFFGAVPGMQKVEFHARFADPYDFCNMINDLCQAICQRKPVITVCDAIMAMEGEGPGTGDPRYLNTLMTSLNPFAMDLSCTELIGFGNTVTMVEQAKTRGLCPLKFSDLDILGESIDELKVDDFVEPKSHKISWAVGFIPDFMKPRPVIDKNRCVGCGICKDSCPKHTIKIENRKARIYKKDCIRCFCCQELCPKKAVVIKRSVVFEKLLK